MTEERILEILDAHCLKGNCEADTRALVAAIKDILAEATRRVPLNQPQN